MNIGFRHTDATKAVGCIPYKGSVSIKLKNNSGQSYLPAPTLQLTDGTVYEGVATLGNVLSGGGLAGFRGSVAIQWINSRWSASDTSKWVGAIITIPYEFSYTSPDGSLRVGMMTTTLKMAGYSAGVQAYEVVGTSTQELPPASACASTSSVQ